MHEVQLILVQVKCSKIKEAEAQTNVKIRVVILPALSIHILFLSS